MPLTLLQICRAYCPVCERIRVLVRDPAVDLADVRCPLGHPVIESPGSDDIGGPA